EKGQAMVAWFGKTQRFLREGLHSWPNEIAKCLKEELPKEFLSFTNDVRFPDPNNDAAVRYFLQRKLESLEGIIARQSKMENGRTPESLATQSTDLQSNS